MHGQVGRERERETLSAREDGGSGCNIISAVSLSLSLTVRVPGAKKSCFSFSAKLAELRLCVGALPLDHLAEASSGQ